VVHTALRIGLQPSIYDLWLCRWLRLRQLPHQLQDPGVLRRLELLHELQDLMLRPRLELLQDLHLPQQLHQALRTHISQLLQSALD